MTSSRELSSRWPRGPALLLLAIAAGATIIVLLATRGTGGEDEGVRFGFNNNAVSDRAATPREAARLLSASGATIDRVQIDWARLEPARAEYRFKLYDRIYRADLAHDVRPLLIFGFAPPWASAGCPAAGACHAAPAEDHFGDAANTAAKIAQRYPRAAGIEIWNEPNTPYFWAPEPDPVSYTAFLRECYLAIKQKEPGMQVAGGSMSSSPESAPGYTAAEFLRRIYLSGGDRWMDALSVHAYPEPFELRAESAVASVDSVRAVRDDFGSTTPIWVTETGMSTTGADAVGEDQQALALLNLTRQLEAAPDVEMMLIHTLIDPARGPTNPETGFGVMRSDLRPKPSYCALSGAWKGSANC